MLNLLILKPHTSVFLPTVGQHNMMPMMNSHDGFPRGPGGRPNQMYPQGGMHNNMSGMHPRGAPGMGAPPGAGMPGMTNDMAGNSVTVRDPFADSDFSNNAQSGAAGGQFPGGGPSPQQNSMDAAGGLIRPGMNSMNQFRNNSMSGPNPNDPYMGNRGPGGPPGNDPYTANMRGNNSMPPGPGNDPYNRPPNMGAAPGGTTPDGFNRRTPVSGTDSFPPVNNRGNQGGTSGQQYPYGPGGTTPYDREG